MRFKEIPGLNGYMVDRSGNVISLPKACTGALEGRGFTKVKPLKQYKCGGYLHVRTGSALSSQLVHRLVAKTFIGNPEGKRCVNHKDGNKLNNNVENLEWVTHSENSKHAFRTGLSKANKALTDEKAQFARDVKKVHKLSNSRIGEILGVSKNTIMRAVNLVGYTSDSRFQREFQ